MKKKDTRTQPGGGILLLFGCLVGSLPVSARDFYVSPSGDDMGGGTLPRQGSSHPRIKEYQLFVSTDGKSWGKPVLKGTFKDSEDLQSVAIDQVNARYFKLEGLSGYTRNAAAVGEVLFHGVPVTE